MPLGLLPNKMHDDTDVVGLISEAPSGITTLPDGGEALSGLGDPGPVRVNATGPFANVTRPSRCN
jgi:hypothetical protein